MVWAFLVSLSFSTLLGGGALGWRRQSVIGASSGEGGLS